MCPLVHGNPYQQLLVRALEAAGAETVKVKYLKVAHVLFARRRETMVNLHWPELIVNSNGRGRLDDFRYAARALQLLASLAVARLRGMRVVWTVHNLVPHEARRPRLDLALNRCIARLPTAVVAHSRHAARLAEETYRRRGIEVGYHGNYLEYYPESRRDRERVRQDLGIPPDAFLVLAFGFIRPYKCLPELIAAFAENDDPRLRLLIAGPPFNERVKAEVEAAAAADDRVVLRLERVPDEAVSELHAAADVAALAYRDVFSSGALLLSLSCGLPVIAPADSTATELGDPPAVQPYRPGGLAAAIAGAAEHPPAAREDALAVARRYEWSAVARLLLGSH